MTIHTHQSRRPAGRAAHAALAAAALVLAACSGPTPLEQHRAGIEATYAKLRALDAPVRDAAPLADDARIDSAGARVVLTGPDANALYVASEHLATPEKAGPYGTGTEAYTPPVQTCGMVLAGQPPTYRQEPEIAAHLQQCANAEYAFVLRSREVVFAKLVDETTFQPGIYDGEVRLYRLADGADLGGFRVSARNGDDIAVVVGQYGAEARRTSRSMRRSSMRYRSRSTKSCGSRCRGFSPEVIYPLRGGPVTSAPTPPRQLSSRSSSL